MRYKLYKCEIKGISIPLKGPNGTMTVLAALDESASVTDKEGKATVDYHRSSYEATYQVVNVAKNGQKEQWRISKITIADKGNEQR